MAEAEEARLVAAVALAEDSVEVVTTEDILRVGAIEEATEAAEVAEAMPLVTPLLHALGYRYNRNVSARGLIAIRDRKMGLGTLEMDSQKLINGI